MQRCGTLLEAERGCGLVEELSSWARENGHRLLSVDNLKDLIMTLQQQKVNVLVMDICLPDALGVHMQEREEATEKAKDLVRMAVARASLPSPWWKSLWRSSSGPWCWAAAWPE